MTRSAGVERPLSPHLQIYRWTLTMALSILHRATGMALGAGTVLLAWWLIAAATGGQAFDAVSWFLSSWLGFLVLIGFTWALFLHMLNGIRHLMWDLGKGFEVETARRNSRIVAGGSALLTVLAWVLAIVFYGG